MTRKAVSWLMAVLMLVVPVLAEASTWTKVRYNGGPVETKVDPKDWNNEFSVTPESITMKLNDGQSVAISPRWVTELTYGQEARRHVALMTSLGILVAPLALFGLFHKQRLHFIGIEYARVDSMSADSTKGGLLIQGADQNYRQILFSLKTVTGKPVQTTAEDAKYVNP